MAVCKVMGLYSKYSMYKRIAITFIALFNSSFYYCVLFSLQNY